MRARWGRDARHGRENERGLTMRPWGRARPQGRMVRASHRPYARWRDRYRRAPRRGDAMSLSSDAVTVPMESTPPSAEFSLVRTWPLFSLQRTFGLTNAHPHGALRRGVLLACVAWLPLVALAWIDGILVGAPGPASLMTDYAEWARFVIAVPLFVAVEKTADRWVMVTTRYLEASGIVGP